MYSIGEIISTYRKKKGLLQQDLADELAKEGITISEEQRTLSLSLIHI